MTDPVTFKTTDEVARIGADEFREVEITLSNEWVEMIRQGYMCVNCFQPLREAWPEKCPLELCGFPIRDRQTEEFARRYRGVEDVTFRPSTAERAAESGLWVPGAA